jgi:hypothetical protein
LLRVNVDRFPVSHAWRITAVQISRDLKFLH